MSWILLAGVAATALLGWWWADSVAALEFVWFVTREGLEAVNEVRGTDAHEEEPCIHDQTIVISAWPIRGQDLLRSFWWLRRARVTTEGR